MNRQGRQWYVGDSRVEYPQPGEAPAPAPSPTPDPAATAPAPFLDTTPLTTTAPAATTAATPFASGQTATTGTGGGSVLMAGRADSANRFNLFDTQSAVPRTRAWFAFQRNEGFNPSVVLNTTGGFDTAAVNAVAQRPTTYLYRGGFELALSPCLSIAAQHQYIGVEDTTVYDPSWGDPQFLVKYALSMDCNRVVSATLGVSPHFSQSPHCSASHAPLPAPRCRRSRPISSRSRCFRPRSR